MTSPTADWQRVGERFYRKIKLYDAVFDQDLELENYVIAEAPYGGALGILSVQVGVRKIANWGSTLSGRRKNTCISWNSIV